jgi:hypothetical protein
MKKYTYLTLVMILAVIIVSLGQSKKSDQLFGKFSDLTLTASTNKNEFLPMEPIGVLLVLSNEKSTTIVGHSLLKFQHNYFEIYVQNEKGETKQIQNTSSLHTRSSIPDRHIEPNQKIETSEVFYNLNDAFSEPGSYLVYFVFNDKNHENKVKSNLVAVNIIEPTGKNAEACAYLKQTCTRNSFVFAGGQEPKFYTSFSSKFAGTVYGDFTDLLSVKTFIALKQYDKAESVLQKMTPSQDFLFINEIEELKTKVRQLEKTVPKVQ